MAMAYPPEGRNDPEAVAHAAAVAVELGCDIVKTSWTGSAASMADVVRSCPIPIVTAGGFRMVSPDAVVEHVSEVMTSGVRGVAMGRNVFEADCPESMMRRVTAVVHPAPAPVQRGTEERAAWSA
jgi:2-amino-4,5-dihydroxy-6-oxo-7-(phosphonooxy)heptanoate synthase